MAQGKVILVLGGARCGKSRYAQALAENLSKGVLYLATATPGDREMEERIARHRAMRPSHWRTLEAPLRLAESLTDALGDAEVVLLDCVTLLVSNLMMQGLEDEDSLVRGAVSELEGVLGLQKKRGFTLIVVSNEVGTGIVPPYPMGRVFRDAMGRVNQWLASRADDVVLVVAGLPLPLKRDGIPVGPGVPWQ